MTLLSSAEIEALLPSIPAWHQDESKIIRTFRFASFPSAISFVCEVAHVAEALDHHPDILIQYRSVTLTLTTHSAGGLTTLDFQTASAIEALPSGSPASRPDQR
jgi:4a-hydroxytetrahydrobiopterin dehydratase